MGRHAENPWTDEERILAERLYRGRIIVSEIAQRLERKASDVYSELRRMGVCVPSGMARTTRKRPKAAKLRHCLVCRLLFLSEGPGNQVCSGCKDDPDSLYQSQLWT